MCLLRNACEIHRRDRTYQGHFCRACKGGSRLDILIGEKALADYKCRFENTQKISVLLSVKPEQTAKAAQKLLQTVADLKQELGALKLRLLEEKVDAVETGSSAACCLSRD